MRVTIAIPTVTGREEYLALTLRGYAERTPEADLEIVILHDRPTCGIGWQEIAERSLGEYIHFSNDDVVPGEGWLPPLLEVVEAGNVAGPWIEPASPHWDEQRYIKPGNPLCGTSGGFYSDLWENQPADLEPINHSAMPFCSREQFGRIGPHVAVHYGVDNWFAERARAAGMDVIGRRNSIMYHYAAGQGRSKGDWCEVDFLDYDCVIALQEYRDGVRPPKEMPPDRLTPEGLQRARAWRAHSFPGPHHWE